MATFQWLTKSAAIAALQGRLNQWSIWSQEELWIYLSESLRHFNSLVEQWNTTVAIPNADGQWINTGTLVSSPHLH